MRAKFVNEAVGNVLKPKESSDFEKLSTEDLWKAVIKRPAGDKIVRDILSSRLKR